MSGDPMNVSDQEVFWRGEFGDEYTGRNALTDAAIEARETMWRRLLPVLDPAPASILEVGANIGLNLRALASMSSANLHAVEPNKRARSDLAASGVVAPGAIHDAVGEALPFDDNSIDLVFTSGVLIHVAPDRLPETCAEMHRVAARYIGCIEYFSPRPEEIRYRDHQDRLFKRDYGGFWLDRHPDLELLDYGFFWKRTTGLDDLTWWLFRKRT